MSKKILFAVAVSLFLGGIWPAEAAIAKKTVSPSNAFFNILEKTKSYNYNLNFSTQFQTLVKNKVTNEAKININTSGTEILPNKESASITIGVQNKKMGPDQLQAKLDIVRDNKTLYTKIKDYPEILNIVMDLSALQNKWVKIGPKDFKMIGEEIGLSTTEEKVIKSLLTDSQNEKKIKEKHNILRKSGAGKITKRLSDTRYEGRLVKRWEFAIDRKKLLNLEINLLKSSGTKISKQQLDEMEKDLKSLTFSKGELAINAKGDFIKITLPFSAIEKIGNTTEIMKNKMEMTIKDINNPKIKIEIPKKTINLNQVQQLLEE